MPPFKSEGIRSKILLQLSLAKGLEETANEGSCNCQHFFNFVCKLTIVPEVSFQTILLDDQFTKHVREEILVQHTHGSFICETNLSLWMYPLKVVNRG